MKGNSNNNTRALVSALRSDLQPLRSAAVGVIDEALKRHKDPDLALQLAFGASRNTAVSLLRERKRFTRGGRPR